MVRERLRISGRTWWEHVLATGTELIMLAITLLLTTYFLLCVYTPVAYHYVEAINPIVLTVICIYMLLGAMLWLYGWYLEKCTSATRGLGLDITGAILLTTGWVGLLFGVMATGGGDWTARAIALALAAVWGFRALAAQRIQSSAEKIQEVIDMTGYDLQGDRHGLAD